MSTSSEVFPREPTKQEALPIRQEPYGYVQKSVYHHPDLYHEEVVELDSPFAAKVTSGTHICTFLLLGDQNAGKSTFLHGFTFPHDSGFLGITSYLPMLSSSFINTRFLDPNNPALSPMDELPFLDTDLARATILLTREDFEFFESEFELPREQYPDSTRFVVIQFIEIGGDHLDALMHLHAHSPSSTIPPISKDLEDILRRTQTLLTEARKTVFFVNATTLFRFNELRTEHGTASVDVDIDVNRLATLFRRMSFLDELFSERNTMHSIILYLSRQPPFVSAASMNIEAFVVKATAAVSQAALAASMQSNRSMVSTPHDLRHSDSPLASFLQNVLANGPWKHLIFEGAFQNNHLTPMGETNAEAVIETMVRLFRHGAAAMATSAGADLLAAHHLFRAFEQILPQRWAAKGGSYGGLLPTWMSEDDFMAYLERAGEAIEAPPHSLLQRFGVVVERLAALSACLRHARNMHASLAAFFVERSAEGNQVDVWEWRPEYVMEERAAEAMDVDLGDVTLTGLNQTAVEEEVRVRFPQFSPGMFEILKAYVNKNVPAEWWLAAASGSLNAAASIPVVSREALPALEAELAMLEESIMRTWAQFNTAIAETDVVVPTTLMHELFWKLEEWCLGKELWRESRAEARDERLCFPRPMALQAARWHEIVSHLKLRSVQTHPRSQYEVEICLEIDRTPSHCRS